MRPDQTGYVMYNKKYISDQKQLTNAGCVLIKLSDSTRKYFFFYLKDYSTRKKKLRATVAMNS